MAMTINTNITAMTAQRNLGANAMKSASSLAKLSSGSRVPSAKDDAAALAIGSKLKAEVSALKQASQNATQAVSMLQIADGALSTVGDILVRMKSLATQASSGQLGSTERSLLQQEFTELRDEITRISGDTDFNGTQLLNGSDVTSTLSYGAPGRLAINGVSVAVDESKTSDNDVFNISYDRTDSTAGTNDIGSLKVTNLTTGESQTIDIFSAINAKKTQSSDGSGGYNLDTNLDAGDTIDVNFSALGITLTLDSNFDVDGTAMADTVSAETSVAAGVGTVVNAAMTSAVSGGLIPDVDVAGTGNTLSTTGLAELKSLASDVYDASTGTLYLNIDEDSTNGDYSFADNSGTASGLEISVDGGTNFYAAGHANLTDLAEGTARQVQVRLATSDEVILKFDLAAHTVGVDASDTILAFKMGDGFVGVDETTSSAASFTFRVGSGTGTTDEIGVSISSVTTSALGIDSDDISTSVATAETAMTNVTAAINTISSRRADIGASQSRLDFAGAAISVAIENTAAATSALLDVDVSSEMTNFTSKQVLLQAGISMLAQANQQPALLLRLLQ